FDGVVTEIVADAGTDVVVGDVIGKLDENGEAGAAPAAEEAPAKEEAAAPAKEEAPAAAETTESADASGVIASPAARKLAREKNIDLTKVVAQDPLGRIRPEDVEAAERAANSAPASSAPKAEAADTAQKF